MSHNNSNSSTNLPNRRERELLQQQDSDDIMTFLDEITSIDYSLNPARKNVNNNTSSNTSQQHQQQVDSSSSTHRNSNNSNINNNTSSSSDNNFNNNMMMMMMPTTTVTSSKPPINSAATNNNRKQPIPPPSSSSSSSSLHLLNTSNYVQTPILFNPSSSNNNINNPYPRKQQPAPPAANNNNNNNNAARQQHQNNENDENNHNNNSDDNNNNIDHQKDHRALKQYLFISYLKQIREVWNSRRIIRAEKNRQQQHGSSMMMFHGASSNNNNMLVMSSDDDDDDENHNTFENNNNNQHNNNNNNNNSGLDFLNNNTNSNNKNNKKKNTNQNEINYDIDEDVELLVENNNPTATILEKRTPVAVDIDMLKVVAISPIIGRKLAEDPESLFYNLLPSCLQGIVEETVQELQLIRNKVRGRETEADKRIIITPANSHLPLLEKVLLGVVTTTARSITTTDAAMSSSSSSTTNNNNPSFRLLLNPLDDFPDLIKLLKPLRATQNICFRPQHLPPYFGVNAHEFSYSRHNNRLVVVRGTVIRHTPTRLVQYKVQYKCPSCEASSGEPLVSALSQRLQGTNENVDEILASLGRKSSFQTQRVLFQTQKKLQFLYFIA